MLIGPNPQNTYHNTILLETTKGPGGPDHANQWDGPPDLINKSTAPDLLGYWAIECQCVDGR